MHNDVVGSTRKRCKGYMNEKSTDKIRTDVEVDRLSSLPDDVIHKILSFISIRMAIETSVLSTRWRSIWTSMPYLDFSSQKLLPEFVSNLFSHRNNQTHMSSVKIGPVPIAVYKLILNCIFSHNVQQLTFTVVLRHTSGLPVSSFSSRSLKHLNLIGGDYGCRHFSTTPSFDLPVLTTLHLHDVSLILGLGTGNEGALLFTKCTNLKNLTISRCFTGTSVLNIYHPQLSNLTLQKTYACHALNVVAPQLKNLTIIDNIWNLSISAPSLTSLVVRHVRRLQISTQGQGLPSLEKVDLCIYCPLLVDAHKFVSLFQQFHNIKFLTLNLQLLEFLFSPLVLLLHRVSLFAYVKILKFLTGYRTTRPTVYLEVLPHEKVTEIENYQLDGSPTMISCEEIKLMRIIESTQKLIECEDKTNKARIEGTNDVKKRCTEKSILELQCYFGEKMANFKKRDIEGLKLPTSDTVFFIVSLLQQIEGLLTQLPASKRDVMQAAYSSVCEEVAIVMNDMKIRHTKMPKLLEL